MNEIITFISTSIASGVVGSVTYDVLKFLLKTNFNKLETYISNNEISKFEDTIENLLEDKILKQEIIFLMDNRNDTKLINRAFKKIKSTNINLKNIKNIEKSFIDINDSNIEIK